MGRSQLERRRANQIDHLHGEQQKSVRRTTRPFKKDLTQHIKMGDVWPEVTEVRDRAHVLNIADSIFWEDGELCHSEKEILDKIKSSHMATLDLDGIREDMRAHRKKLLVDRQDFQQELHEMRGPFGRMMHYL